jgi:hypothetical protein
VLLVLWFLVGAATTWVEPMVGYVILVPLYAWILFGRGATVVKGSWPATFMMEDVQSERGVRVLFWIVSVLHTLGVAVLLILQRR